jgi:hypothetical protein
MRGTVYYVVRGNIALRERGTQSPQLEYLAEPFIVASPEGARGIPEKREYVLRAKIFARHGRSGRLFNVAARSAKWRRHRS